MTKDKLDRITNILLMGIKEGRPFTYDASLKPGRLYSITINTDLKYVLSCNNLKKKEILSEKQVKEIISNCCQEYLS